MLVCNESILTVTYNTFKLEIEKINHHPPQNNEGCAFHLLLHSTKIFWSICDLKTLVLLHINVPHSYLLPHNLPHHLPPHCLGIALSCVGQEKYHHVHSPESQCSVKTIKSTKKKYNSMLNIHYIKR